MTPRDHTLLLLAEDRAELPVHNRDQIDAVMRDFVNYTVGDYNDDVITGMILGMGYVMGAMMNAASRPAVCPSGLNMACIGLLGLMKGE